MKRSAKIAKSGSLRTGLLSYKHFLETGETRIEILKSSYINFYQFI